MTLKTSDNISLKEINAFWGKIHSEKGVKHAKIAKIATRIVSQIELLESTDPDYPQYKLWEKRFDSIIDELSHPYLWGTIKPNHNFNINDMSNESFLLTRTNNKCLIL